VKDHFSHLPKIRSVCRSTAKQTFYDKFLVKEKDRVNTTCSFRRNIGWHWWTIRSISMENNYSRNPVYRSYLCIQTQNCFFITLLPCTSVYQENRPTRCTIFHLFSINPTYFSL